MTIAQSLVRHVRPGAFLDGASRRWRTHSGRAPLPRRLARVPSADGGGHSARRVNALLAAMSGRGRYLEIGLGAGHTFEQVRADLRYGVDPNPRFDVRHLPRGVDVFVCTSDHFFETTDPVCRFDVVFVDGLHTYRQTYRDLVNALAACPDGAVLVDDVVPCDAISAMPDAVEAARERAAIGSTVDAWHGDVFRVIRCLHNNHPELHYRTLVEDNPQTIVWLDDPHASVTSVEPSILDAYETLSYDDVFGSGIPEWFHPVTEVAGLSDWAARR